MMGRKNEAMKSGKDEPRLFLLPGCTATRFTACVSHPPHKQENAMLNLVFNIAVPALIMGQLSGERWLGPRWGLIVALLFPLGYGIWDYIVRKKANFISVLGFAGVLLSGVFGLM